MNKKNSLTLLSAVIFLSILACSGISVGNLDSETIRGTGPVIEETREIASISAVELSMQGTLYVEVGSSESMRISAEESLLAYILTEVRGDRLVISTKPGYNVDERHPISFYLTVVSLDEIDVYSSGDVEAGDLNAQDFTIELASSGSLMLGSLACDSLHVNIYSSGNASLAGLTADSITISLTSSGNLEIQGGQVQEQDINMSSSGKYEARELASARVGASLSSSGSATIRVSDDLNGSLSSSGNIYYIGNPSVDVGSSSSGKAIQIDE